MTRMKTTIFKRKPKPKPKPKMLLDERNLWQCPNENCRGYGKGMQNIARQAPDYDNFYCGLCNSHYAGYNGELKFYTKKEWEKQFEPEYDQMEGGKDFFKHFK